MCSFRWHQSCHSRDAWSLACRPLSKQAVQLDRTWGRTRQNFFRLKITSHRRSTITIEWIIIRITSTTKISNETERFIPIGVKSVSMTSSSKFNRRVRRNCEPRNVSCTSDVDESKRVRLCRSRTPNHYSRDGVRHDRRLNHYPTHTTATGP